MNNKIVKKKKIKVGKGSVLLGVFILIILPLLFVYGLYFYFSSKLEPIKVEKRQKIKVEKIYIQ
ncbi:MAG: hypothetical protein HOD04_04850 [Elusimicrobiaceae bacterium]|nr:hypothetical protein [Elusimicrobiaceae bacterium]MBT4403194.1 hypothetical protein [Elusimicrobiaceae bacterium]MBT4440239.1 hypothetical protein [Elusimicrobiaceae bacterium]MBT5987203.1 hypothetical protein [Elusimicrobiaceae bacterium]